MVDSRVWRRRVNGAWTTFIGVAGPPPDNPAIASFTAVPNAATPDDLDVTFDGSASSGGGVDLVDFFWNFGDGTSQSGGEFQGDIGTRTVHTYDQPGAYTVTLTVTAADDDTASQTRTVTINASPAPPPTVTFVPNVNNLTVTATASTTGAIDSYLWDFGDGSKSSSQSVSHTYAAGGSYTIKCTVVATDNQSGSSSQTVRVTTATITKPTAAFNSSLASDNVTCTFTSTSVAGTYPIAIYSWSFGDGGTSTSGANVSHVYKQNSAAQNFAVSLTVSDSAGNQATANKTITIPATTPPPPPPSSAIIGSATSSSTLHPSSTSAIVQDFIRSTDTGDFYTSQVHPESGTGYESVRLSRMATSGAFLDEMLLTDAGHGTSFALEYTGGTMYIWLSWHRATDGVTIVEDLVRFPYRAGTYTRAQVTGLQVKVAGPTYRLVGFDKAGGYAVLTNNSGHYQRHPIANVLAGNVSAPVNTIDLSESPPTMQGFATYYDSFFRYTGVANDNATFASDKPTITEYSWQTGGVVRTIDTSAFGPTDGTKKEPEGLSIYNTGQNPVLFFGVSTGPTGGPHSFLTWWYPLYNPNPIDIPPPPPPPAPTPVPSGNGDPGVNRNGNNAQQTGTGITLIQNLSGSDLTAKVKSAGTALVSFGVGTYTWNDFTHGIDGAASPSGNNASGLQLLSGSTKGILGAGGNRSILQMNANTSTKGSTVPASSGTNQLQYIDANNLPNGFVWDGVNMTGTAQGHLYNGLRMHNPGNVTFTNSTFGGIPGSGGSPPGETFTWNIYAQAATSTVNVSRCTFDGRQNGTKVASALLGTNNTSGVINITDCLFQENLGSAGPTIWELHAGGTINLIRPVTKNLKRNVGNEAQAGTINIYDPLFDDPISGSDDIRITWTSNFNLGTINVYFTSQSNWNAFIAPRVNKKILTICSVAQAYGGSAGGAYTGTADIRNYCHVYIAGVKQTLSNFWTFTGKPVN